MQKSRYRKFALPVLLVMAGICIWIWRYQIPSKINFASASFVNLQSESTSFSRCAEDSTVVHFYARWCGPCLREMREIKSAIPQMTQQGIKVIFISDDPVDEMRVMANDFPEASFLHVNSMKELGVHSIPASYFLLHDQVVYQTVGSLSWDERTLEHFNK
ncbi:MAG: TlpA family protein disulfide reductase [Flavobacteriales bacterium]